MNILRFQKHGFSNTLGRACIKESSFRVYIVGKVPDLHHPSLTRFSPVHLTRYLKHAQVERHLSANLSSDDHTLLVSEDENGNLKAYSAVHWLPYLFMPGSEGYISELFVSIDSRSLGIGTRLLDTIRLEAQQRGCTRLSLINMRHRESYQRGFYKSHGWQERPEAANFLLTLE